jgi:hypothetical protein
VFALRAPVPFMRSPLLAWTCAFFLVVTTWAVWTASSPFDLPALRAYYRSLGFLAAFVVIFDDARARRAAALTVAAAVVVASALNLAELFEVVRFAGQEDMRVAGRAGGLYVNANVAGFAIVFGLAIAVRAVSPRWHMPLLVVATAGVFATFSRGAAICLAALLPLLVWRRHIRAGRLSLLVVLVAIGISVDGGDFRRFLDARGILTADTSARLELEQDDSGRAGLARNAWEMFLDAPFAGNGLGATLESHNQFLTLAGDHGLVGLLLFPALALALVLANPGALPLALVLLLAGVFSHNLLDDRTILIALALAAARDAPALPAPDRAAPPLGEAGVPIEG